MLKCHNIIWTFLHHLIELALPTHKHGWAWNKGIVLKSHIMSRQLQLLMGGDGLGDVVSVKDWPWCWVKGDEAALIAKTFTAAPAIVIFHRAPVSLIRMISCRGEGVVKGTCLTRFSSISQKLSHKDFPLLFWTKTELFSIPQICLLSTHFRWADHFSLDTAFLDQTKHCSQIETRPHATLWGRN